MRLRFLVDGFNVYHGLKAAADDQCAEDATPLNQQGTRWFDLRQYCESFVADVCPSGSSIERIQYFSAFARHMQARHPDVVARHHSYIECLQDQGIEVMMGQFKELKGRTCPKCGAPISRHEEKETDVAMAANLMAAFAKNECDAAVLVTGDTDMVPVVKVARGVFPHKKIGFLFPYRRSNEELVKLADFHKRTKRKACFASQLPDPFVKADGSKVLKPASW